MSTIAPIAKKQLWTSSILSGLPALFLLFDAVGKFAKPAVVVEATVKLGYPEHLIMPIGAVLLVCTIIYLIPRTAVLGAILLTGYLGGAVNTHVRMGGGWFPILFPVLIGALLWGGLYWRERRLHAVIPLTTKVGAVSGKAFWSSWALSLLPMPLLFLSAYFKLSNAPQAMEGFIKYGYPQQSLLVIGIVEVLCTVLYLIPRTAVLGAILLTGYLGGAASTHIRVGEPFFIPILFGVLLWGGLYLRDERLRVHLPLRR
ncbi:MAG: DoxX family protein [Acidobacteriota bacterium]|nr:DoxX family protein [Acidobacteriota bacterium]